MAVIAPTIPSRRWVFTPWPAESALGPPLQFPPGFTLFREGAEIRTVYLLTSGVVKMLESVDGQNILVGIRTPNWLIGVAAAIRGDRHVATIAALSDCEVRPLAIDALHRLRRTDTAVCLWLQDRLCEELLDQLRRCATLASDRHGEARLERLVVDLFGAASTQRADGSWKLTLSLTVTELGTLIGFGREWTSKILGKWRLNGVLEKHHGWFVIPATSRLVTLVEMSAADTRRVRHAREARSGPP